MLTKAQFAAYDATNPHVYQKFEEFTLEAIQKGRTHLGAKMVWERLRWYTAVEAHDDTFKLNNNYPAFYARKFMDLHPEHKGFFACRTSVADAP